jgi:hypothetical protein
MFRITFIKDFINESMAEALPDFGNTSGVFCIFTGCDDNFEHLNINTKNLNLNNKLIE